MMDIGRYLPAIAKDAFQDAFPGPILWLPLTLALYAGATALHRRYRQGPLFHPAPPARPPWPTPPNPPAGAVWMEIPRRVGGPPAVTATLTILTGIIGAVAGPYVLDICGIRGPEARGFALGVASHGIATARAFTE